ncbi:FtsX-like permease family protein [Dactylosporangium sp. NPDC051485]|uniref:FtsX-like permease family protein n=1 Tax=Dactylosporangium sp. NPDC051485 TaxID=3154846 RepID=UPI00342A8814
MNTSSATAVLREAYASARSQVVASLLTVAVVAGMCVAVLLTSARTAAAQQAVIAHIDALDTRSIVVRADASAGISTEIIDQLQTVRGIAAITALGPPTDAHNAGIPDGTAVPIRPLYGAVTGLTDPHSSVGPGAPARPPTAIASPLAALNLGLVDGQGGLLTEDGEGVAVTVGLRVPAYLAFLEPLVVRPVTVDWTGDTLDAPPVTVLVVLATSPAEVAVVTRLLNGLLAGADQSKIHLETSAQLAAVRAVVNGELNTYGRGTILGILATSAALTSINLLALVTMRRRDFGRRRALGATRMLIVTLLLTQVGILAVTGVAAGITISVITLNATGNITPPFTFIAAVSITAIIAALLAALPPALIAARRDPLHELRVP